MKFSERNTSFWYNGYLFQGLVILGFLPILLPLFADLSLNPSKVGMVVAAVYVGQLTAPFSGAVAQKFNCPKLIFLSGYFLIGLGYLGFLIITNFYFWLFLAFLIGTGSSATNTLGGMYIVEYYPKNSWDRRIGWMQTYYGLGQALGVWGMIYFQKYPAIAMALCSLLMIPGIILSAINLPKLSFEQHSKPKHSYSIGRGALTSTFHYHKPSWASIKKIFRKCLSPFSIFLFSWFLLMIGTWMIYNLYPLLMRSAFNIDASLSSLYFAIGASLGVVAYPLAGTASQAIGNKGVLFIGFLLSLIPAAILMWFAYFPSTSAVYYVAFSIILLTMGWSPLIVGGTALTARLATIKEGEALGLFNASTATASVIAAIAAGHLAQYINYASVTLVAAAVIILSMLVFTSLLLIDKRKVTPTT
ncbi:MAG: MFS transporter [Chlamydiota bacterium]